jgi:hypothetical protein
MFTGVASNCDRSCVFLWLQAPMFLCTIMPNIIPGNVVKHILIIFSNLLWLYLFNNFHILIIRTRKLTECHYISLKTISLMCNKFEFMFFHSFIQILTENLCIQDWKTVINCRHSGKKVKTSKLWCFLKAMIVQGEKVTGTFKKL